MENTNYNNLKIPVLSMNDEQYKQAIAKGEKLVQWFYNNATKEEQQKIYALFNKQIPAIQAIAKIYNEIASN